MTAATQMLENHLKGHGDCNQGERLNDADTPHDGLRQDLNAVADGPVLQF